MDRPATHWVNQTELLKSRHWSGIPKDYGDKDALEGNRGWPTTGVDRNVLLLPYALLQTATWIIDDDYDDDDDDDDDVTLQLWYGEK